MSYPAPPPHGYIWISLHSHSHDSLLTTDNSHRMNQKKKDRILAQDQQGTDHLKQLIKFVILAIQKGSRLDEDGNGRISLTEILSIITTLGFKFPAVYSSLPIVRAEWRDLSPEELDELVAWFAEEFDLPGVEHGKLEAIIKKSVAIIVDNYNHVQDIRAILQPPPA